MKITLSREFVGLYDIISNNSYKTISLFTFDTEKLSKLSTFECYIISRRLIDMCNVLDWDALIKGRNITGGIETLLSHTAKFSKKFFDIYSESNINKTFFNKENYFYLVRLNGRETINTKNGSIENNEEALSIWKSVINSYSYYYALYILNNKLPKDLTYTAGTDLISDIDYFLIGSIYYLFSENNNISERKKVLFLSVIAEHLNLDSYKRWEKKRIIKSVLQSN